MHRRPVDVTRLLHENLERFIDAAVASTRFTRRPLHVPYVPVLTREEERLGRRTEGHGDAPFHSPPGNGRRRPFFACMLLSLSLLVFNLTIELPDPRKRASQLSSERDSMLLFFLKKM